MVIVRGHSGLALAYPGLRYQALPHPERFDGTDTRESVSACWSTVSAMDFGGPQVGEIAVFHPPRRPNWRSAVPRYMVTPGRPPRSEPEPEEVRSVNFIKRIVAGPGDALFQSLKDHP